MRKQIAAANWKMNGNLNQAETLLRSVLDAGTEVKEHQLVLFAVPFPFLVLTSDLIRGRQGHAIAAQNCHHQASGAFTGEVSVEMLASIGIEYCLVGHSERREYFNETNEQLAQKINLLLQQGIMPVFCCGEPLAVREQGGQEQLVEQQVREALFHLPGEDVGKLIIAYEPVWAIGTGKTATTEQAQEMHAFIRRVIAGKYGSVVADEVSILYGGSVKATNAAEIFSSSDVDGGLVGGASLVAADFVRIIQGLK